MERKKQSGSCCGSKKSNINKQKTQQGLNVKNDYKPNPRGRRRAEADSEVIEAKIVLIGDMAVGKSSLAGRFNHGEFKDIY